MQAETVQGLRLSPQQQRLWLLQGGVSDPVYSSRCALRLEGNLDRRALAAALRMTVERHEILRTAFQLFPGLSLPLQVIREDGRLDLREVDLRGLAPAPRETALSGLSAAVERSAFDLGRGEVLRGWLAALSAEENELVLALPAVCADAATLRNLAMELMEAYAHLRAAGHPGDEDSEPPLQYADITEWQHQLLEGEETADELESRREDWRQRAIPVHLALRAPLENGTSNGGPLHRFAPGSLPVRLDPALEQATAALLAAWEIPAPAFFLACWQMLLQRSTGREDVLVGVLHDGRRHAELRSAMGPLARYVPVHCRLGDELRAREIVDLVRAADAEAERGQERFSWPHMAGPIDPAHPPDFPFCFSAEEGWEHTADGLRISVVRQHGLADSFKLELRCARSDGRFHLDLRYDSQLFSRQAAELFAERLAVLVR